MKSAALVGLFLLAPAAVGAEETSVPRIALPKTDSSTSERVVEVAGLGPPGSTVTIMEPATGKVLTATVAPDGRFRFAEVELAEGRNRLRVCFVAPDGAISAVEISVTRDARPPLSVTEPREGSVLTGTPVRVAGSTAPGATVRLKQPLDGAALTARADAGGEFVFEAVALREGKQMVRLTASDGLGRESRAELNLVADTRVALEVLSPRDGANFPDASVAVIGRTDPDAAVEVFGPTSPKPIRVKPDRTGKFALEALSLEPGRNLLRFRARDASGNVAELGVVVRCEKTEGGRGTVSLDLQEVEVRDALRLIASQTGLNIVADESLKGKVSVALTDVEPFSAVRAILHQKGFLPILDGQIIRVRQRSPDELDHRVCHLENISLEDSGPGLMEQVRAMLSKKGTVVADERTNCLFVADVPERLSAIESLIRQTDDAYQEEADQRTTRVFHLASYDLGGPDGSQAGASLLSSLTGLLTSSGSVLLNSSANTVIASDERKVVDTVARVLGGLDASSDAEKKRLITRTFKLRYVDLSEERREDVRTSGRLMQDHSVAGEASSGTSATAYDKVVGEGKALTDSLKRMLSKEGQLTVDARTNSIVVTDLRQNVQRVVEFLAVADRPVPVVRIETRIVEVRLDKSNELGVSLDDILGNDGTIRMDFGDMTGTSFLELGLAASGATGAIRMLSSKTDVKLVSCAEVTTLNGRSALIRVATEQPVKITTRTRSGIGGEVEEVFSEAFQLVDIGVILRVRPFVLAGNLVKLNVHPEIRELEGFQDGFPIVATQESETTVIVPDGRTLVISGLVKTRNERTRRGIPVLSQIPVIGLLFGYTRKVTIRTELLIFITTKVVRFDPTAGRSPTAGEGPSSVPRQARDGLSMSKAAAAGTATEGEGKP